MNEKKIDYDILESDFLDEVVEKYLKINKDGDRIFDDLLPEYFRSSQERTRLRKSLAPYNLRLPQIYHLTYWKRDVFSHSGLYVSRDTILLGFLAYELSYPKLLPIVKQWEEYDKFGTAMRLLDGISEYMIGESYRGFGDHQNAGEYRKKLLRAVIQSEKETSVFK